MCKCDYNINLYNYYYKEYNVLEDRFQNIFNLRDDELKNLLVDYFHRPVNSVPDLTPELIEWVKNKLIAENRITNENTVYDSKRLLHSSNNNISNFSVAKSFAFLQGLKEIKNRGLKPEGELQLLKNYSNLTFVKQQNVEEEVVKQTSTVVNKVDNLMNDDWVTWVTGVNPRPTHDAMDKVTLKRKDMMKFIPLLSDWGCNCRLELSKHHEEATLNFIEPKINIKEVKDLSPSHIDLSKGKLLIFKSTLPVFQNLPPIVRRQINMNGF